MNTATRYPMHFSRGFLAIFLAGGLLGAAVILFDVGLSVDVAALLLALAWGGAWAFAAQFLVSRLYFVEVTHEGIAGSTLWGRRGFVRWDKIGPTRRYYVFPMGLVHVRTVDGTPALWLPTHVRGQHYLVTELRKLAPLGHPLLARFGA